MRVFWMSQRPGNPTGGGGSAIMRGTCCGGTLTHELGHAAGLPHAKAVTYANGVAKEDEYGDPDSPMGRGSDHFSPAEKFTLGWMHNASITPVPPPRPVGMWRTLHVLAPGEYWIDDYKAQRLSGPKALLVKPEGAIVPAVLNYTNGKVRLRSPIIYDLDPLTSSIDFILDIGQTATKTFAALWGGPVTYPTLVFEPLRVEGNGIVIRVSEPGAEPPPVDDPPVEDPPPPPPPPPSTAVFLGHFDQRIFAGKRLTIDGDGKVKSHAHAKALANSAGYRYWGIRSSSELYGSNTLPVVHMTCSAKLPNSTEASGCSWIVAVGE